jgi:UDP-N-acetylmuramoyl-tripeptide--D-alanyl-D-alanine ligase
MYKANDLKKVFKKAKFLNWCDDFFIKGVSHDTRKLKKNDLYIAIKGEKFDGHSFVSKAKESGAACVLVSENVDVNIPKILVSDTVLSYLILANDWRKKINLKDLIGITGSNGKTTTKDFLFSVLSSNFDVYKNEGNLNNFIGLPYSILKFPKTIDYGIIEMGMNTFGEIKKLSKTAIPSIGIITNIGEAHIGFLKNKENIFKEKIQLFNFLIKNHSKLVINLSDPMINNWFYKNKKSLLDTNYITYSDEKEKGALKIKKLEGLKFELTYKGKTYKGQSPIYGDYNFLNIAASLSVVCLLGLDLNKAIKDLSKFNVDTLRSNYKIINGAHFFIDCYNANPNSMSLTLKVYENFKNIKRKIAILGDMLELGDKTKEEHEKIGRKIFENNYDILISYGDYSSFYKKGFLSAGGDKNFVYIFSKKDFLDFKKQFKKIIRRDDFFIVKASRSLEIEKILED